MAVLGQIRQRSFFLIIVIGMALFAFVISGVFTNNLGNSSPSDPVAVVNDKEVEIELFRFNVEQTERNYNYSTLQAVSAVWDQTIRNTILNQEYEILGIDAGKAQLEEIISSNDAFLNDSRFLNQSGFFDFGLFTNFIISMKTNNPEGYENWKSQEANLIALAKERIYLDLIRSSAVFTDSEGKAAYHMENDQVSIEYVQLPYSLIPDSIISISDREIKQHISDNPDEFKRDPTKAIRYVLFNEEATEEDILNQRTFLESIIDNKIEYNDVSKLSDTIIGFKEVHEVSDFVSEYSSIGFDSIYKPKGKLSSEYAEILFNLPEGEVFGPYKDENNLKITRIIDRKKGGSIRASHILVAYKEATRANSSVIRNKNEAKKKANNLFRRIRRNPSLFEELVKDNSDGPSNVLGGDLGFFQDGYMAPELYDFANKNRIGKIGLVETEFGFHVIKIKEKQDIVLTADIIQPIVPSESTSNDIFKSATIFEMEAIKAEINEFEKIAESQEYEVKPVEYLNILDDNLPGLPQQRQIVQWAFNSDSDVGDIKKFNISTGGYAVVQITKSRDDDVAQINEVRSGVFDKLKNEKKAKILNDKYFELTSLEDLSEKSDNEIQSASALTQLNAVLVGAGQEPYVIGAAFSLNINQTSDLINGLGGLYKIRLINKNFAIDLENYSAYSNTLRISENSRINAAIYEALKSSASIEDNRSLYY
ncbi:MAG: peptidylprolyl isomerase [Flavobacteriaceae bacterium]|nr:peptidylprolyl isomerase [Flavobacteriaceae bacterium]